MHKEKDGSASQVRNSIKAVNNNYSRGKSFKKTPHIANQVKKESLPKKNRQKLISNGQDEQLEVALNNYEDIYSGCMTIPTSSKNNKQKKFLNTDINTSTNVVIPEASNDISSFSTYLQKFTSDPGSERPVIDTNGKESFYKEAKVNTERLILTQYPQRSSM